MRPMSEAPTDGTRILIQHTVHHYQTPTSRVLDGLGIHNAERRRYYRLVGADWYPTGPKWEEAWWDEEYLATKWTDNGPSQWNGAWMPWCGQYSTKTSPINHPLGWVPLPGEENGPSEQHRLDLESHKRMIAQRQVVRRIEHDLAGEDDD